MLLRLNSVRLNRTASAAPPEDAGVPLHRPVRGRRVRITASPAFFGPAGNLAATMPKPGQSWQAVIFEAIIIFGLVLMVLNLANGPKLNGPFVPLAVGACILAWAPWPDG
jgi:hypothetical protein